MEIEAIGSNLTRPSTAGTNGVSQEEFIRLFVSQLQVQDPLEPQDNSQFMAQLAQFTMVSQLAQNGASLESIGFLDSVNQGTSLLGKTVEVAVQSGIIVGEVTQVRFGQNGPSLTVKNGAGQPIEGIRLSQVQLIRK